MNPEIDRWARPSLSLPSVLAANVQRLRKGKGWSQEELARRSWLTRETIRSVEGAEADARISTVEQLAIALGVTPVTLLRETQATRAFLHAIHPISPHLTAVTVSGPGRRTEHIQPPLVAALGE